MRLTLDWDSEEIKDLHLPARLSNTPAGATERQQRLSEVIEDEDRSDTAELWQSSGGKGYHYVEYGLPADLERIRQIRTLYGDDQMRIEMDGMRIRNGSQFPQVLYHMKGIKPGESRPYETGERAELLARDGFDAGDLAQTKNPETGRINYPALITVLAEEIGSRAALFRKIQNRPSVDISTEPRKRGYDIVVGRTDPTVAERKALRDYARARDLGHYGEQGTPVELENLPSRTVFHEYFEVPEIEFGTQSFGLDDEDESPKHPANLRTGTYGDVDEMTLKQIHDEIADRMIDQLSPGSNIKTDEGTQYMGLDLERFSYAISLERDRPMDKDEVARYRRVFWDNQPSGGRPVTEAVEAAGDPFGEDEQVVTWEIILYEEEYAGIWWVARGILDISDGYRNPVADSQLVADTNRWL